MTEVIFYPDSTVVGQVPEEWEWLAKTATDDSHGVRMQFGTSLEFHRYTLAGPVMSSIESVAIFVRRRNANPSLNESPPLKAGFYNGAASYSLNIVTPRDSIYRDYQQTGPVINVDPCTGGPWDPALFATYEFALAAGSSGGTTHVSRGFVIVNGIVAGAEDEGELLKLDRGSVSGVQQLFRRPLRVVELEVPLRYYDVPLLKWITLSHWTGPVPDALGWDASADKPWRRMRLFVLQKDVDLSKRTLKLRAFVDRDVVMRVWDVLVSEESPDPDLSAGMARFHQGGRLLSRASAAWVEDAEAVAQGGMYIQPLESQEDKHSAGGTWIERLRTNWLLRSASASGLTGLTLVGEGVNGSDIAVDGDDLIFPSTVSENSLHFVAGNPVADVYAELPTTQEFHANSVVSLAVYHKDIPTAPYNASTLSALIRRGVDGLYWDYSAPTVWSAVPVWYPFPQRLDPTRDIISNIDLGPDLTTVTVAIGIDAFNGLPLQENRVYSIHLADGRNPGTPIVSDDLLVHGFADDLRFASLTGKLAWNPEHGHVFCEAVPEWASADLADGEERVVCEILYSKVGYWLETIDVSEAAFAARWFDDVEFDRLSYVKGTGWRFRRRRAGVNTDAVLAGAVTAGQELKLAAAWTGPAEEQDRDPYTLSVYVDGVKGTDAIAAGKHDPIPANASLTIGSSQRWLPTDLAGCKLWVEADRGTGTEFRDGAVFAPWGDQSGNGNDLNTGGLPKLYLDQLNGLPVARLDGLADFFIIPDLNLTTSHWFLVIKPASITDGKYILGHDAGGTVEGDVITDASKYRIRGGAGFADLISTGLGLAAGAWSILELVQYSAAVRGMHNGVHGSKPAVAADYSSDLNLGANGEADFKEMDVYAVLVYDHVLRMDEARIPLRYLAAKCALSPLGASHRAVFNHFDGKIRHFRVGDVVPFDDELGDMP